MQRDRRRLAAIMSADVVGFSRLMGLDESGTLAALKAHRGELVDAKIAEYAGRIVKTTGDGLLVEFPSVVDAVRCAVDVQRGMKDRNNAVPEGSRILFRIGINVGDIIIDGDDIFGDGVNVAARLESLADPGGICVNRVVRDQVLDKLSFTFEEVGTRRVKNIARPLEVFRIRDDGVGDGLDKAAAAPRRRVPGRIARRLAWAAGTLAAFAAMYGAWQAMAPGAPDSQPSPAPPFRSFAVLPIRVDGATPSELVHRIADELKAAVRSVEDASLVSGALSDVHAAAEADPRKIGARLNVRYVLRSSVRASSGGNELAAELVDADCESP